MKITLKIILSVLVLLCFYIDTNAQELYYLTENFETPETRSRWSVVTSNQSKTWKYTDGGQAGGFNPDYSLQGERIAGVYYPSVSVIDTIMLISPALELGGAVKPTLRFWHSQYYLHPKGTDNLRLYFRTDAAADWDLIQEWTDDISTWEDEIIDIEDIDPKYLTDNFQLAFAGLVGKGYGVYLDSITVKEDAVVEKFVKRTTYKSVEYEAIPAGATDIPMEEIVLRILGNSGEATLDSLTVIPNGVGISALEESSFKLYYSISETFGPYKADTSTLLSTATLSGGKVVFADIDFDMILGDNHFWVAASLKNNVQGSTSFNFSIPANGINVSDTIFPASIKNLSRTHRVFESIFYDDFETGGPSWTLEGNFEVGWPAGNQIENQKNPSTPFNGTNILATDLDGAYFELVTTGSEYYAYTPVLDLTYYINTSLYFHSYSLVNGPDDGVIDVSTDGGSNWQTIWNSDASSNNVYWTEFIHSELSEIVDRESQFQLRIGITNSEDKAWPGFSIDNFAILSEKLNTDVAVTDIVLPYEDCLDCGNDTVRAWFRNFADGTAPTEIPVFFGLYGADSVLVRDTIYGGIAKDDSVLFTFSNTANFPQGDIYDKFVVGVDLATDQDPTNDQLTKTFTIQQNNLPPHFEDFEYKGGIWLPEEGSTWTNKDMTGTITTDPQSPNIWVLSPFGNYLNSDTSWVTSGCYNLSGPERNLIELKYWSDTEAGVDGARFEYSVNDGSTWEVLEDPVNGTLWNWTTNPVTALGSNGWSGINNWTTAKAVIPAHVDTVKKAKFRMIFMSNGSISQAQGFAFNDLHIYETPTDVGVSTIEIPKDTCQYGYPDEMRVWVTNYGYNDLKANDTMIIGYDFESEAAVVDTFLLGSDLIPGDSAAFNITTAFDVTNPGTYQVKAYTLIEDDPFFYVTNNDTAIKSFTIWQNPITGLADTISSREPDTLSIEPIFDLNYSYLWDDMSTSPTYDVDEPGTLFLTVTESVHGCQTYDSVFIELLFNDVGIEEIIWPESSCELSASENVQVQIRNFGTDSLITNEKIMLYYELNGGPVVVDSVMLDAPLYSGAYRWFTFANKTEDFTAEGDYQIKSWTYYGGDTVRMNDTVNRAISIFGYPNLNLGPDLVLPQLEYTIDATDPEYATYLWENGDTNSVRLIDSSGVYTLTVVDTNGCDATDNIDIWFKITDIQPQALISPVSSCNREGTDVVTVQIWNAGTDTIKASDNVILSYKINENTRVTETVNGNTVLPGQTFVHTFSGAENLTNFATYNFNIVAQITGDLRTDNDTLVEDIITNTNPEVDLGIDDDQEYYVTEMVLDAGDGTNYTYEWQDGSTERYYTVTTRNSYAVTVTDSETGCYGNDEAFVRLNILDYMITTIDIDQNACLGTYEDVRVTILNNGNLPRGGANIQLDYTLNGEHFATETYVKEDNWRAGGSNIHTTLESINLKELGKAVLEVTLTTEGDLRPENDNFIHNINVQESPEIGFGGQLEVSGFPYELDAGSGHDSYLWSTGATSSTINAPEAGEYFVTVTGTNGCQSTASVYIDTVLSVSPGAEDLFQVSLYPNPARDYITVEAEFEIPGDYIFEIINMQQNVVFEREIDYYSYREELFVGDLPPGVYFVRFRKGSEYYVRKMIIQ